MGRLQTARLENFIRRWGSIKGPGSVLAETLGEVFPILDLENLTPENHAPAGWTLFFGFGSVTAVAAQLAGMSIINPAGSSAIVVIDGLIVRPQTSGILTVGNSLPLFTQIANAVTRDTRLAAFTGRARIAANANVGAAENGLSIRVLQLVDRELEIPRGLGVLGPGGQLAIVSGVTNVDLTVSFYGRIRDAEPSELSF